MQTVGSDYFLIIDITILRAVSSDYYSGTDEASSDGSSSQTRREEEGPDCCTVTAAMYNITESSRDRRYPISAKSITLFDSVSLTWLYICPGSFFVYFKIQQGDMYYIQNMPHNMAKHI